VALGKVTVLFHASFKKKLSKLPIKIQEKFFERLALFYDDPFDPQLHNHFLKGALQACRSINVTGDIRALYVQHSEDILEFQEIGTHAKLYHE
jgi:addiction module RelE/StbE family toxin